jgi:hypothetical protein
MMQLMARNSHTGLKAASWPAYLHRRYDDGGFRLLQFVTFGLAVGLLVTTELNGGMTSRTHAVPHNKTNISWVVGDDSQWTCAPQHATDTAAESRYLLSGQAFAKRTVVVYQSSDDPGRSLASWSSPHIIAAPLVAAPSRALQKQIRNG